VLFYGAGRIWDLPGFSTASALRVPRCLSERVFHRLWLYWRPAYGKRETVEQADTMENPAALKLSVDIQRRFTPLLGLDT